MTCIGAPAEESTGPKIAESGRQLHAGGATPSESQQEASDSTYFGKPMVNFDYVTASERCALLLTQDHRQIEQLALEIIESRGGIVPHDWQGELRKRRADVQQSVPLLFEDWAGPARDKVLSEGELPSFEQLTSGGGQWATWFA